MIRIDGSQGEGGGQIVRTSLALSCLTGQPVTLTRVRAGRKKPGLLRQHLCGLKAAAAISDATVDGAELGSTEVVFRPGQVRGGSYEWAVGSAGSAGLVLQTVLPPLLVADSPSTLSISGGTHNPASPSADFLADSFLPMVNAMGPRVDLTLGRHGFYPAGGGRYDVAITPAKALVPVERLHRDDDVQWTVRVLLSNLKQHIGFREMQSATAVLGLDMRDQRIEQVDAAGPGNAVVVRGTAGAFTEVFTSFGRKKHRAERVGREVAEEAVRWWASGAPVSEHLADQLLIPLAMAGGGAFRTGPLSSHTRTNLDVVTRFLGVRWRVEEQDDGTVVIGL